MPGSTEQAVQNHQSGYSCSAAVLCAFREEAGLTEAEARQTARPFAGGRMGKCGAVMAAEYVLEKQYGAAAPEKIAAFEAAFTERNGSLLCRELRAQSAHICRQCVRDAAELLASEE